MFNCWNATSPPMMTARNRPTIMKRRSTAKETRRSIFTSRAGGRAVDEQAAPYDDLLARLQIAADLDIVAIDQTGLDFAKLERFVVIGDPQPHAIGLVDQRLLLHAD